MLTEDVTYSSELFRFLKYQPDQPGPTPANLWQLEQLLYGIWGKQSGKTEADQQVLLQFQNLCGLDPGLIAEHELRVVRSLDKKQPILVGLDANIDYQPGKPGVLVIMLRNPTATLFREVRVRLKSSGLLLADDAQPLPIKLLESRDALPVYLPYQTPTAALLTTLALEVDVCDHNGEWRAYNNRSHILLNFPGPGSGQAVKIRTTNTSNTSPLYKSLLTNGAGNYFSSEEAHPVTELLQATNQPPPGAQALPAWDQLLPVELELDRDRTHYLQASAIAARRVAMRGATLSRALLRSQNSVYAPERIELVSRSLLVCGRYIEGSNTRIGDFGLGLSPGQERISRLQCALYATEDGLSIMHTSRRRSHTAVNGAPLARGEWRRLESGDEVDICGLYPLQVVIAWDVAPGLANIDEAMLERDRMSKRLLEIVDLLDGLQQQTDPAVREQLKTCYASLVHAQNKSAARNGVNSLGSILYARLERQDAGRRRILHIYLPKWLSVGSSAQAGLRINAPDVAPQHAELLYKENMYWIQNRVDQGGVWVCNHSLAPNEAIPLEDGDTLRLGGADFVFERY